MTESNSVSDLDIPTPLGWQVHLSADRWRIISEIKHPSLAGHHAEIVAALSDPDEIRRSSQDPEVYLFYKAYQAQRWFCAVARDAEKGGFLITAYQTSAIKAGETIWQK